MDFNNILIGSADPDALAAYYTKLFGEPAMSDGGYTGWQIGSGSAAGALGDLVLWAIGLLSEQRAMVRPPHSVERLSDAYERIAERTLRAPCAHFQR
jgi:hypothetical protein